MNSTDASADGKPSPPTAASPSAARTGHHRGRGLLHFVQVLALLYLFLLSVTLLGTAFKTFGSGFSHALIATTTNPVVGLMIGLLATSLIQSSSSTTSIVVGLVAVDALTIRGAIPLIMGANMGTTVTNTLVAMASINRRNEFRRAFAGATMHDFFNLLAILLLFPLEQATHVLERLATGTAHLVAGSQGLEFNSPIKTVTKPVAGFFKTILTDGMHLPDWFAATAMLVLALAGIFFSLTVLSRVLRRVVLLRAERGFYRWVNRGGLVAMIVGLLITISVQSSSITTSLMVPLIGAGIVPLEAAFAVTLGANLGTTVTALLASLTGNLAAVTVALVHVYFNLTGILVIYPLPIIRRVPIRAARILALRTSRSRLGALAYMLGVFFILPLLLVLLDRLLRSGSS